MLTPELASAFGDTFVSVAPGVPHRLQQLLQDQATALYLEQLPLIERLSRERGARAVPRLVVYDPDTPTLPSGDIGEIHVSLDGSAQHRLQQALEDRLNRTDDEELRANDGHVRIRPGSYLPQPREKGENAGYGRLYPRKTTHERSDTAKLNQAIHQAMQYYRKMPAQERERFIDCFFEDADRYDAPGFLCALRVFNGMTQKAMGACLGLSERGYECIENGENKIALKHCLSILNKNIFHLPTVSEPDRHGRLQEIVQPAYASALLSKLGYEPTKVFHKPLQRDQLWSALHVQHDEAQTTPTGWKNLPQIVPVLQRLLQDKTPSDLVTDPKRKSRLQKAVSNHKEEKNLYPDIPNIAQQMGWSAQQESWVKNLPYTTRKGRIMPSPYSPPPVEEKAQAVYTPPTVEECVAIAHEQSMHLSEFLSWYRTRTKQTLVAVAGKANCNEQTLSHWEKMKYSLTDNALRRIKISNCYSFPHQNGLISPVISDLLSELNTPLREGAALQESAISFAREHSRCAGEYLKFYRESMGATQACVGSRAGRCADTVKEWERKNVGLSDKMMMFLLRENPYQFPSKNGHVCSEVINDIHRLNNQFPKQSRWMQRVQKQRNAKECDTLTII